MEKTPFEILKDDLALVGRPTIINRNERIRFLLRKYKRRVGCCICGHKNPYELMLFPFARLGKRAGKIFVQKEPLSIPEVISVVFHCCVICKVCRRQFDLFEKRETWRN